VRPVLCCYVRLSLRVIHLFTERDGGKGAPAGNKTRGNLTHTAQSKATQRKAKPKPKPSNGPQNRLQPIWPRAWQPRAFRSGHLAGCGSLQRPASRRMRPTDTGTRVQCNFTESDGRKGLPAGIKTRGNMCNMHTHVFLSSCCAALDLCCPVAVVGRWFWAWCLALASCGSVSCLPSPPSLYERYYRGDATVCPERTESATTHGWP
jgi:hypothetical protein